MATQYRTQRSDSLMEAAQYWQQRGNNKTSMGILQTLLAHEPTHIDGRILYARILGWEGHFTRSLVQFDSVLSLRPDHDDALFGKSLVLSWSGAYAQALPMLEQLAHRHPESDEILMQWARVQLWSGNHEQAYELFSRAEWLQPESEEAVRGLARSSASMGRDSVALRWYQRLLEIASGDVEAQTEAQRLAFKSRHEVQLYLSREEFNRAGTPGHQSIAVEYYYTVDRLWKPYIHGGRMTRFGKDEVQWGGGVYGGFGFGTGLFAQLLVVPSGTVAPRLDITLNATHPLAGSVEGSLGVRYLAFADTRAGIVNPAVTVYAGASWSATAKAYLATTSQGFGSATGMATATYRPRPVTHISLSVFSGHETFRAATIDEITSNRSAGLVVNARQRLTLRSVLQAEYQFSSRRPLGDSHTLTIITSLLL